MKEKDGENVGQFEDLIFGKNAVLEMLKSPHSADTLYIVEDVKDKTLRFIISLAKEKGAVVKTVHAQKLTRMCASEKHQGVALRGNICEYASIADIFVLAQQKSEAPFLVICDGIEDPHNLGAIIRTAVCAGVHGVIIPERRGCAVTPAVHRASAGACSHIPIARVGNLAAAVRDIKSRGVFCYCADSTGETSYQANLTGAVALVVGAEGHGVSRLIQDLCDVTICLPMFGAVNSLNASVAAGILMYEVVRQNCEKERSR